MPSAPRPAVCPATEAVDPAWLAVGVPAERVDPEVPPSLRRRVGLWTRVWGSLGEHQHLLVDERAPWVVHAEVDCRDLFGAPAGVAAGVDKAAAKSDATASARCGERLTSARRAAIARLKVQARSPALLRRYDGNRSMAKDASRNVMALQGRKDALGRALARAVPNLGFSEALFAQADVPVVYARAAIVESLWRPEATSRSGAVGAYQFMAKTGRQFLAVEDGVVDERLDPLRASWAAAVYMKKMKRELSSWPLVLTAYNTGPARLKGVMKARRTRDLGRIADAGDYGEFGFDGQNYYAQIVAIASLTEDTHFDVVLPLGHAVRVVDGAPLSDLAACLDTNLATLAEANPALHDDVVAGHKPVPAGYVAFVPQRPVATAQR